MFETIEVITGQVCGQNSCGDTIYCRPAQGDVTHYKVTIRAANLQECDPAEPDACPDPNFGNCVNIPGLSQNVCQSDPPNPINYPRSIEPINGVADAAANSLNGNRDDDADGPTADPYFDNPGERNPATGDNYTWEFYISNRIDLNPPEIINNGISPPIGDNTVELNSQPRATFNKLLSSSSLRSGTGYRDGLCQCNPAAADPCNDGEFCDVGFNPPVCRTLSGRQNYCRYDSECRTGPCLTHIHVRFIQNPRAGERPIGYWVESQDIDVSPLDGVNDRTIVEISHSQPLSTQTQYGVQMGSGIRDIYQNCYLPSEGPGIPGPRCNTTEANPYCCDGTTQATPCP
jgi:hypothetical protein